MMRKFFILILCLISASCATKPQPKVNVISNKNTEIVVESPKCPDWTGGQNYFNPQFNSSFYGCSTINNYGKMIADPMDMLTGKSSNYYDGQTTANAVKASRTVSNE